MLEQYRGFLFLMLGALTFIMYTTWQNEQQEKVKPALESVANQIPGQIDTPRAASSADGDVPDVVSPKAQSRTTQTVSSRESGASGTGNVNNARTLLTTFSNDVLEVTVNGHGDIVKTVLKQFDVDLNSEEKVTLLRDDHRLYVAQSGIYSPSRGQDSPTSVNVPDKLSRATWEFAGDQLVLQEQDESLAIPFRWTSPDGVEYTKTFTIHRSRYLIDVDYTLENKSPHNLANISMFTQIKRDRRTPEGQKEMAMGISSYTGAAYSTTETNYETYNFDEMDEENLNVDTKAGWVAFLQHYFVSAWVPEQDSTDDNVIFSRVNPNGTVIIGISSYNTDVAAGSRAEFKTQFYAGPKNQRKLSEIATGLDKTIDYGVLFFLGQPLFYLLTFFHDGIFGIPGFGNWGMAIIMVTLFVKLLLYPIVTSQYRSMAKIKELHPKLLQIRERYADDRQRQSQAMMELYKREKVNPLGGCFQMLLTFPVFIALYWVLIESVEIRHAPFMLWIQDLSSRDPYYILPVLMGASMFLMQKMQPISPTQDPMQVKMMQMLPVIMTAVSLFFPAGLVLYWLVNTLLSMAQQTLVTKQYEAEKLNKKKNA